MLQQVRDAIYECLKTTCPAVTVLRSETLGADDQGIMIIDETKGYTVAIHLVQHPHRPPVPEGE
jgi:hypothetical protein